VVLAAAVKAELIVQQHRVRQVSQLRAAVAAAVEISRLVLVDMV
jgi:hypothetical protein